jgi:CRP-like cAMP-binding protein
MSRISTVSLRTFLTVAPDLNVNDFRPLKQVYIARQLGLTQPHVSLILGALVRDGFLEVGQPIGPANTYRPNVRDPGIRWVYRY